LAQRHDMSDSSARGVTAIAAEFTRECLDNAERMAESTELRALSREWIIKTAEYKYSYNFSWMGRPVIQFPQDLLAMQEIIWRTQPELIVETGVAHGGSLVFYASILELIGGTGHVIGVDIDIRHHNRIAIETHPMATRITLIEGSSTDATTFDQVRARVGSSQRVLVCLDSNHTEEHVAQELELYSTLVAEGGYLVVFDTVIEQMPNESYPDRAWGVGNNPYTAVRRFLSGNQRFVVDTAVENKLLLSVAPSGYLRCVQSQRPK
jgi:cephalosporin hydroxylase